MATRKSKAKGPAKPGPTSLLRLLDENSRGEQRRVLFSAVAERVESLLLTHDEAALITAWFRELAAGKDPKRVFFGETRGRKRGSNSTEFLKGQDVSLPDHVDLCWTIRQAVAQTGDEDRIFALFAQHYGKTEDYLRRIYARIAPQLAPDPMLK